jgi:hypothetical protein
MLLSTNTNPKRKYALTTLLAKSALTLAFIASLATALPLRAQSEPAHSLGNHSKLNVIEILYKSSSRPDGAAEVSFSIAGHNGFEIHQERSRVDARIISRTIMAPVPFASPSHLSQTNLILEKDPGQDHVVLNLHFNGEPKRSARLILPSEPSARTGSIQMGLIFQKDPGDGGTGGSGGGGGTGCYPCSGTSDRCGTVSKCCPSPSFTFDAVTCSITCN